MTNIPRELILAAEDGLVAGARRAFDLSANADSGHVAHVRGQLRHFQMNEAFHNALSANGAKPTPIKGSAIITGSAGLFTIGRLNTREDVWASARRSRIRREMSLVNRTLEPLAQSEFFSVPEEPKRAVAFFVATFSLSAKFHPEAPLNIELAVPNRDLTKWLFKESLSSLLQRYEVPPQTQHDGASPKLKLNRKKQNDGSGE